MSSFKRKTPGKQATQLPGTRPCPGSISTTITSTGIPSLDDLLGGGIPLSCSLLVNAPDPHSSYGELVQKLFIAQGLACGQDVLVIDPTPAELVKTCMWMPGSSNVVASGDPDEEKDEEIAKDQDQKIKIAWRYEQMKQFKTTVASPSTPSMDDYCRVFDLTSRIPESVVEKAIQSQQLILYDVQPSLEVPSASGTLIRIEDLLIKRTTASVPLRICIPSLGSPLWGELSSKDILHFLFSLRSILRRHANICASLSLPSHWSAENAGGQGWVQKLGWFSDALITLSAFTANPSLSTLFPSHHGLVQIHSLPAPHTLLSPSDRFSTLRGLSASTPSSGSGENNLAFKCTRKRLVFETLHLDLEGGVSERRTTPSNTDFETNNPGLNKKAAASVEIEIEEIMPTGSVDMSNEPKPSPPKTTMEKSKGKKKKAVAFHTDRPDVYDF
ncbi:PAXNEB-domain-containing protein [Dendrothele bispora CBS 962.96]|uniref:Elongator complex protein 4 n=1 Tax=Dendrothele bispora (strain CBS 962.96) TaxID=1314807 RepID=A0A4S8LZ26_DENBC|nr:PAXNEB-domain-containing protein [Dendrothele bispora CBS 962.96]